MKNNLLVELNELQMQDINGGGGISYALGFLKETAVMVGEKVWDYICEPKVGGDTNELHVTY